MIQLSLEKPFAQGGNRLCFIHPQQPEVCIKVRRPDFTLADCRRKKGFPKNLRPLYFFDDNREEFKTISKLNSSKGEIASRHVYRCYGFVETDLGKGLATELIRDPDGRISLSLKQYIWKSGFNRSCQAAVDALKKFWMTHLIPSRDLLTHNIVAQQDESGGVERLVVIDGLGSPHVIPFGWLPPVLQQRQVRERIKRFDLKIEEFVENCRNGKEPSRIGMLFHRG